MKAVLSGTPEQLLMEDMKDGDIAVITGGQYKGLIVQCVNIKIFTIGLGKNMTWDNTQGNTNPIRLLEVGETITLVE
jgi:hypothetical protein